MKASARASGKVQKQIKPRPRRAGRPKTRLAAVPIVEEQRTCPACGSTFWAANKRRQFCDADCRAKYHYDHVRKAARSKGGPS